ncbi:MAG: ABC transporter substrate-binding protein [Kiritimatiellae bacterium]|nr:ABC transporter substrate-binding protein [Kiritimatiellia bacterium]
MKSNAASAKDSPPTHGLPGLRPTLTPRERYALWTVLFCFLVGCVVRWIRSFGCFAAAVFLVLGVGCSRQSPSAADAGVRIVSTAPCLTECLFAIGAGNRVVGRTDVCNYPPEAEAVPVTGKFAKPFIEATLAAAPTHIVEMAWFDADIRRRFEEAGVPVVHIPCTRTGEVPAALRRLGALTGCLGQAEQEARRLETGLAELRKASGQDGHRPRVLTLVDASSPITIGPHTFLAEMVALSGCTNLTERGVSDYYQISPEWVLKHEPDILLCLYRLGDNTPDAYAAHYGAQPGWRALRVIREKRICTVHDLDAVCRPGPRLLDGLAELRAAVQRFP